MALYLGSTGKVKINMFDNVYQVQLYSTSPITNGIRLLTFNEYIIKDSNGLFLTSKREDE